MSRLASYYRARALELESCIKVIGNWRWYRPVDRGARLLQGANVLMAVPVASDIADGLVPVVVGVGCANDEVFRPIFSYFVSVSFQEDGKDCRKGKFYQHLFGSPSKLSQLSPIKWPSPSFHALRFLAHVGSVSSVLQAGRPWTAVWSNSRGVSSSIEAGRA